MNFLSDLLPNCIACTAHHLVLLETFDEKCTSSYLISNRLEHNVRSLLTLNDSKCDFTGDFFLTSKI